MNQKPSERIKELFKEQRKHSQGELGGQELMLAMVVEYLDEEWEKKHRHPVGIKCNECYHEN